MIKVLTSFITFCLLICSILIPKNAEAIWDKHLIVITPRLNYWDRYEVSSPSIISDGLVFKIWYQGFDGSVWSIGSGSSIDGDHWLLNDAPVLTPEIDERDTLEPSVITTDKYYMYYDSRSTSFVHTIRLAVSDDGVSWTKHPESVLVPSEPWEIRGVTDPSVIYHDGKYRMFYGGWGTGPWQIGYAESEDGINWAKSPNNPLTLPNLGHLNGSSAAFYDGKYHLFYHTGDGIANNIYHVSSTNLSDWECEDGCVVLTNSSTGFDSLMTLAPAFLRDNGRDLLYYAGSDGTKLQIGLATQTTESEEPVIVLIPGLFGSWNKEALLHQQPVSQSAWQLNPIVTDYDGILNSLNSIGKQEGRDYFVFHYDWRKGVEDQANDFDMFLVNNNLKERQLKVIGHSLGGLVARIYSQKFDVNNIEQIITVGTPHQGVAQVYRALAGGEFIESNPYLWLAQKMAVQLYRTGLETDREIIENSFPVLSDLLPTYTYLYRRNDNQIPYTNYLYQNSLLAQYGDLSEINSALISTVGEKGDTAYAYKLGSRNFLDKLLNNYPEGRPEETKLVIGDFVVPGFSAQTENHEILNLDHGELIYKKQGIESIFNNLGLNYQEEQIHASSGTQIFPSILFLVLSPVTLEVEHNGQTYQENEGVILIPGSQEGNYALRAHGNESGEYTLIVGNLSQQNDQWLKIEGKIEAENPQDQIDEYQVTYENSELQLDSLSLFEQIYQRVAEYNMVLDSEKIGLILANLDKFRNKPNRNFLKNAHSLVFKLISQSSQEYRDNLIEIIEMLEEYYSRQNFLYQEKLQIKLLNLEKQWIRQNYQLKKKILLAKSRLNMDVKQEATMLNLAFEKFNLGKTALAQRKIAEAEIMFLSAKKLLLLVR